MIMPKEIDAYCPKCNTHTLHTVKLSVKGSAGGLKIGNRRHNRKLLGYHGKIKGQATVKKMGKKQKVILTCKECNYSIERVVGGRTRKRLELKAL
ncbi:MAG: 50S ribosomal protein L44e [Candidatus Micrarchaeia archaeon]